jgi:hypothetical protein
MGMARSSTFASNPMERKKDIGNIVEPPNSCFESSHRGLLKELWVDRNVASILASECG